MVETGPYPHETHRFHSQENTKILRAGAVKNLIVIPAYNEEESLEKTVAGLQRLPSDYEILIVDDGSTDKTVKRARSAKKESKLEVQIVSMISNGGIGVAVQTGYIYAKRRGTYRYVIQFDADGQHDPEYIESLVSAV